MLWPLSLRPEDLFTHYPHVKPVEYFKAVPRTKFPQTVRNTLGSVLTVFRADIALPYIQSELGQTPDLVVGPPTDTIDGAVWAEEIEGQASGQILEALDNIDHHDFQLFVAGLLEAMGYETMVGAKGKDGGVDVLAYPDVFGLQSPRIKVQVKNQKSTAGYQDAGYLNGVLGPGEKGLFICTGGFTKDAQEAGFVKNGQVALADGHRLLELLLAHYEEMPGRAKELLPLRRVYIPEKPPQP